MSSMWWMEATIRCWLRKANSKPSTRPRSKSKSRSLKRFVCLSRAIWKVASGRAELYPTVSRIRTCDSRARSSVPRRRDHTRSPTDDGPVPHHLNKHLEEDPATKQEVRMAADCRAPFPEVHTRRSKNDVSDWCDVRSGGWDDEPRALSISRSWHQTLHLDLSDLDLKCSSAHGHR